MPLKIVGNEAANELHINETYREKSSGTVTLKGENNVIVIATDIPSATVSITMHGGSRLELHKKVRINNLNVVLRDGSTAVVGEGTVAIGVIRLFSHERAAITIGRDCLVSGSFQCVTSDMHSIIDVATGHRINRPGDIYLGDHVWAAMEVTLLKGTHVESGSIIGARSTVTGHFRENTLILGFPARVVKRGVTWKRDLLPFPEPEAEPETEPELEASGD
jgi:acetyltransferase-like isoleucine patch superfamily enzyme